MYSLSWIIFGVAVLSFGGTWLSMRLAHRLGALDLPDPVKIHRSAIPRLGGVGIVIGVLGAVLASSFYGGVEGQGLAFLSGAGIVAIVGFIDDTRGLAPWTKLGLTAGAAGCLVLGGGHLAVMPRPLAWLVSAVIVVGICHAVNLIDGLDGLAAGVAGIAALAFLVQSGAGRPTLILPLSAGMIGAVLGFLPWNWHPARTFMGDVGSLFLGFTLATLLLLQVNEGGNWSQLVGSFLILGVPLGDVGLTLLRRVIHRRPLFTPDPYHFYNVLMLRGFSHRSAVLLVYSIATIFAGLGLAVSWLPANAAYALGGMSAALWLLVAWRVRFLEDWKAST